MKSITSMVRTCYPALVLCLYFTAVSFDICFADSERGVVWEEVIIMLPSYVSLSDDSDAWVLYSFLTTCARVVNRSISFFCRQLLRILLNSPTGSGVQNVSPCTSSKQITDQFRCHFIFGQATSFTKSWKAKVGFYRTDTVTLKMLFYQHLPETQRRRVTPKPDRNHPWDRKP